jgi:hypothetical protein
MFSRYADVDGYEIELPFEVNEHGSAIVFAGVSLLPARAYVRVPGSQPMTTRTSPTRFCRARD